MALDSFMMDYIPQRCGFDKDSQTLVYIKSGHIYNLETKKEFCSRIYKWLTEITLIISKVYGSEVIIAMAPGHQLGSSHAFLSEIIDEIVRANPLRLWDGRTLLQRTVTVQKSTDENAP